MDTTIHKPIRIDNIENIYELFIGQVDQIKRKQ